MQVDDPNLPLLESAATKLAPFLQEIVFIGGVALGLLITDKGAAPIRGTNDVDVIARILTYADYIEFSQRLRQAHFTEDSGSSLSPVVGTMKNWCWTFWPSGKKYWVIPTSGMRVRWKAQYPLRCPAGRQLKLFPRPSF